MPAIRARALYIHGFNSSPASHKAQTFLDYCRRHLPALAVDVPRLSHDPAAAMERLEAVVRQPAGPPRLVVGSSLGGYYATWLAEQYGLKAALVNPAVAPHRTLGAQFLGRHRNWYTGEEYELTPAHAEALARFDVERPSRPRDFLLLAQTGDEVLDYRLAVERYAGCQQIVQPGGNHAFENFEAVIPCMLAFAGLDRQAGTHTTQE